MAAFQSQTSILVQDSFPFREVSTQSVSAIAGKSVQQVLAAGGMMEVVGRSGYGFPNFPETRKVFQVAYFKVKEDFRAIQPLFLGLISIGQPSKGSVEYYEDLDTFSIKYYQSDESETAEYLQQLLTVLNEEIRFKRILKSVIKNQEQFENENQLLKRELFAEA